jgi:ArsR family transcriptional regulator, arsenate/arsenite/antimonite-responsive transcriptional repressor
MPASPPAADLFCACAEPTRLRLLRLLQGGELCVCHLVHVLQVPQPTISRHLASLRRAGLVQVRKEGLWCHYSLAAPRGKLHAALIDCVDACGDAAEFKSDALRARKLRKSLACC